MILAITIGWGEIGAILAGLAALAAIAAFTGSWLGRHYKEQHILTQTRADLDRHLADAAAKEQSIISKIEKLTDQSVRNGEQIATLGDRLEDVAIMLRSTTENVNVLRGAVSAAYTAGRAAMGESES